MRSTISLLAAFPLGASASAYQFEPLRPMNLNFAGIGPGPANLHRILAGFSREIVA